MSVLFVDYISKDNELKNALSNTSLTCNTVNSYDEFIEVYDNHNHELCVVYINDSNEASFLMHYMVQHNTLQKILYVKQHNEECYFERNCKLCQEFEIKSVTYNSIDNLISAIEEFDTITCENKKS